MPQVTISDETFARLQRQARPLVDTIDTVMTRALDALDILPGSLEIDTIGAGERRVDPRALPSLTHTKILGASLGGAPIAKANWNSLLDEVLRRTMKHAGSFEALRQLCPVNMAKGKKVNEGYSHLSDINISVQGQDANGACRGIVTAVQAMGIALDVSFMWRHKEGAAHPGQRARIAIAARRGT
jgi:hypothetical protein